jgi:hypothetical protein
MVYESENPTTCSIKLKWGFHFEKKNVMLFHLMVEVFQVVMALILKFVKNKTSNKLFMQRAMEMKVFCKCSVT